ncbi:3645_t:CDS:2 [Entrophospora sp. SA101]|nr:3645_t:CDS:2 [Entrophospora sp. SA101]
MVQEHFETICSEYRDRLLFNTIWIAEFIISKYLYPDYLWYMWETKEKYHFEFFYVEVSYGPRARVPQLIQHVNEDRIRNEVISLCN